jgi:hypothetical protein
MKGPPALSRRWPLDRAAVTRYSRPGLHTAGSNVGGPTQKEPQLRQSKGVRARLYHKRDDIAHRELEQICLKGLEGLPFESVHLFSGPARPKFAAHPKSHAVVSSQAARRPGRRSPSRSVTRKATSAAPLSPPGPSLPAGTQF